MAGKKDKPLKLSLDESIEIRNMYKEIQDICNKYRGSDMDIDTPYKYLKNHTAYSIKQYTE